MRVISFSLYGSHPRYCEGAIRNVRLAREMYAGWKCLLYVDYTVPKPIRDQLIDLGAELDYSTGIQIRNKMLRRFLVNDRDCDRYIIRDADSRVNGREAAAVAHWIQLGRRFHCMRDHPAHARPMNGGMWGAVARGVPDMWELVRKWPSDPAYGNDQEFLTRHVWPIARNSCVQHDSVSRTQFAGAIPFPRKRNGSRRFVGEVFDVEGDRDVPRIMESEQINPWRE
jgi:hypothetical protein